MDDHSWPSIIPLEKPYGQPFPVEALPAPLQAYTKSLAEAYQVPADLPAMLMLASASVPLAKRVQVKATEDWIEPCNLYVAVVLPPASRKSAIFKAISAPLENHEQQKSDLYSELLGDQVQKLKILEKQLKIAEKNAIDAPPEEQTIAMAEAQRLRKELPEIPIAPRILVDDISPEKLASLLADQDGRIALMSAEGGVFDMIGGRYSSGTPNLDVYLKSHAGDTLRVDRVGRDFEQVHSPALTIGITIQPEILRGLANKPGFRGRGLLARFLFSLPPSGIGNRKTNTPPVLPGVRASYHRIIMDLFRMFDSDSPRITLENAPGFPGEPFSMTTLVLDNEASRLFESFREKTERDLAPGGGFEFLGDWAGKYPGVVARIAGILHMVKGVHEQTSNIIPLRISIETMQHAIRIGEYLADHALVAFEFMGLDQNREAAAHVLSWIERKEILVFSLRDAHQDLKGRYKHRDEIASALRVLEEHGYVRGLAISDNQKVGRKASPKYEVNPEIHPHNTQNCYKSIG